MEVKSSVATCAQLTKVDDQLHSNRKVRSMTHMRDWSWPHPPAESQEWARKAYIPLLCVLCPSVTLKRHRERKNKL